MAHRKFATGAVRDSNTEKPNFLDYMDMNVLWRYGVYMKKAEAKYGRGNWKKGIPKHEYLESLMRHLVKLVALEEGEDIEPGVDHAAAILFNITGFMREEHKEHGNGKGK